MDNTTTLIRGFSIPPEWKFYTVDEIKCKEKGAVISGPFGSNIGKRFFMSEGVPVIRGNNLTLGTERFVDNDFVFVSQDKANELNTWAKRNDIVFTAAGTLGQIGIIDHDSLYDMYIISNKQLRLRVDEAIARPLYVYYWFSNPKMIRYIQQRNTGSVIPLINLSVLRSLPIVVPPLHIQDKIVGIFNLIDKKIKLNKKIGFMCNQISKLLFRKWFVAFEFPNEQEKPYKSNGGQMIRSEIGEIPLDWNITTLGEIIDLCYGQALRKDNRKEGKIPVYGSNGIIGYHNKSITTGPGIIVGRKGYPGTVILSMDDFFSIDTTFYVVPKKGIDGCFYLFHLLENQNLPSLVSDTAVPGLNRNTAYRKKILYPDSAIIQKFDKFVRPLFDMLHRIQRQTSLLVRIRDFILPKLLSGDIKVI